MKRLFWFHLLSAVLCSLFVAGAVETGYVHGLFRRADNLLYDLQVKWRGHRPPSGDIVLVLMDQASANTLDRQRGHWSRFQLAAALDHLRRAGADVIGVDLVLAAPDPDPAADRALADAIDRCGNVVLARVTASQGGAIQPLPMFQAVMVGDGFIDVPLDDDDVLRRIRFFHAKPLADGGVELLPAFSLEVARVHANVDFAPRFEGTDHFLMGPADGPHLVLPYPELIINYGGDYRSFPRLSFSDVVRNRFPASAVNRKIVLIGSSLAIEKDYFSTPFSRFQQLTPEVTDKFANVVAGVLGDMDLGVSCHAWAIDTILSRNAVSRPGPTFLFAAIAVAGIAGTVFYIGAINTAWSVALLVAGLTAAAGLSHWAFVSRSLWVDTMPLVAVWAGQFVFGTALQKTLEHRKNRWVTDLFGKYVSPHVVRQMVKGDLTDIIDGQHRDITVLFSDLRGFTALSEELGARKTRILLNVYFDAMLPVIMDGSGTVDKLIGDAIMAFFGAPVVTGHHPQQAAECALAMITALEELNTRDMEGVDRLNVGIGLNSGRAIVGNLGSHSFMDYTVIGDTVNLASRLESLNKHYHTRIILSESTAAELGPAFVMRKLDRVRVSGRDQPVTIFELLGRSAEMDGEDAEWVRLFEKGVDAFQHQELENARQCFVRVLEKRPSDVPAGQYLKRIDHCLKTGNPAECVTSFQ